jgi:opacity protein-like surface antigen
MLGMPRAWVGVRGGLDLRRASAGPDDFYDFVTSQLTLSRSDFNALSIAADVGVAVAGPVDLVVSLGHSSTSAASEFRDWVDEHDNPIAQRTTLSTIVVTAAARWNLTSRGRQIGRFVWIPARLLPYVGAGAGAMRYALAQDGYFVDSQDLSIFRDRLSSGGWTHLALLMAGADYGLSQRLLATAEARWVWANAELRRDFVSFDDGIDLSGFQFSLGLRVRI